MSLEPLLWQKNSPFAEVLMRGLRRYELQRIAEARISDAVDNAEEIQDPLDDLPASTKAHPGAPFVPEVLAALAALRQQAPSSFEDLRA